MENNIDEFLAEIAGIRLAVNLLEERQAELESGVRSLVERTGLPVQGHGVHAYMKEGRKSTDHKQAVDDYNITKETKVMETIKDNTTHSTSIAWAKVTKELGIDIELYTTQAPPEFAIEIT